LVFELFLKTTGGKMVDKYGVHFGETPVDVNSGRSIDDPFICDPESAHWVLEHPKVPHWDRASNLNLSVPCDRILPEGVTVKTIEELVRKAFLVLEAAWTQLGCRLIDIKFEFGINAEGNLVLADVVDNDSWRLRDRNWRELSKQLFRDCASMEDVADKYALVANLVQRLTIPHQAIVLWRGSANDDAFPVIPRLAGIEVIEQTMSGHKAPAQVLSRLEELLGAYPDGGVIMTFIGMSNGLGPMLAARTSWPVITVPTTAGVRPHDVWSNLEVPSQVPLLTVLSPKNAVLSALNMLAQKNPVAYMHRQYDIEELEQ
jgi:phosphoribosylaminoimidazole carboxylase/phosphoribosylaminoimidazole-succinocarboxamide synthase